MNHRSIHRSRGSSLIEVVVAASILSVAALTFLGVFAVISRFHERDMYIIKGELLAEEAIEAARLVKTNNWSVLSGIPSGETRYLSLSSSAWGVTTTPEVVDGFFYRSFTVSPVQRDATNDIVTAGGTVDTGTVLVTSSVAWKWRNATTSVTYSTYLTNI
jgi:hypothetical protein